MKKITMIFATVLMVAGLAASAFADPGWSNGPRHDNRGRHKQTYQKYDHRDHREPYYQPVVVYRVPVRPPEPVVHVIRPYVPSFSVYLPHMSIQIR